tara:strand:+ start:137 stop:457 length:321 start_codon:yes stop_codon:yes gene_type:complete
VTPILLKMLPEIHFSLGLLLAVLSLGFLIRIISTWYSQENFQNKLWMIVFLPTEPFLKITRVIIPPIGGVDITPVIWFGIISLLRELLVGQQGLISQILRNSQAIT